MDVTPYPKIPTKARRGPRRSGAMPEAVAAEVLARSMGQCEARLSVCKRRGMVLHHVRRRSQGGADEASNLLHLCAFDGLSDGCHEWIHAHPAASFAAGWLRRGT